MDCKEKILEKNDFNGEGNFNLLEGVTVLPEKHVVIEEGQLDHLKEFEDQNNFLINIEELKSTSDFVDAKGIKEKFFEFIRTEDNNYNTRRTDCIFTTVTDDAPIYKMNHPKRGKCVIFNHKHFDKIRLPHLSSRHGTETDGMNLFSIFKKLGFTVEEYKDLTYIKITEIIENLVDEDHRDCDCLVLCFLSHGEEGILYSSDRYFKPDILWSPFQADRCPTLAGKPKLFFIQACQGDQLQEGTTMVHNVGYTATDSGPSTYKIPNRADFLIAFSTLPGYFAWRNVDQGAWFIQALCDVLQEYASTKDLMSMLTVVNRRVALYFESFCPDKPHMHGKKQIPFITSTLTRDIYF